MVRVGPVSPLPNLRWRNKQGLCENQLNPFDTHTLFGIMPFAIPQ